MKGRRRSTEVGVKAGATRRRMRACSSPSMDKMDGRRFSTYSSDTPAIRGMRERAEWKRRSRSTATASS